MNLKRMITTMLVAISCVRFVNLDILADTNLLDIPYVPAKCVAVIDMESGRLLYGKNQDKKMAMASTTKIMTALIALEQDDLDSYFEVDSDAIKVEGTSMGLLEGDQVTLRTLAYGMLLPSGNDAAEVVAWKISGGNKRKFINMMNDKAKSIGCKNTHFVTPSGLDADGHYSTARDMANIAKYALRNSNFADICKNEYATIEYGNPPYKRTLKNHNKLLANYDYCIGVKTGYTENAGKCLVSAAIKDGIGLIVVTLDSNDICESHVDIYEKAFSKLECSHLNEELIINTVKVVGGEIVCVPVEKEYDVNAILVKGEKKEVKSKTLLKNFIYAPIKKGTIVGEIDYYINDFKIAVQPIITSMDANKEEKKSIVKHIIDFIIRK